MDPALVGAGLATLPALGALLVAAGIPRGGARKRRIREALKAIDVPGSRRDLAMVIAMGGDPVRHRLEPVLKPSKGMRLIDADGHPVRFMSAKQMASEQMRVRF